jgi:hypothetical protein
MMAIDTNTGNACQIISSAEIDVILRQPELEQAEFMVPKDLPSLNTTTIMPLMTTQNNDSYNFVHVNITSVAKENVISSVQNLDGVNWLPKLKAEFMVPSTAPSLNTDDNNKNRDSAIFDTQQPPALPQAEIDNIISSPISPQESNNNEMMTIDTNTGNACQIISSAEIDVILRQPELEQAESMVPKDLPSLNTTTIMPLMTTQNNDSNNFVHVNITSVAKENAISSVQNLDGVNWLPELKAEFMVPSTEPSLNTDDNNKNRDSAIFDTQQPPALPQAEIDTIISSPISPQESNNNEMMAINTNTGTSKQFNRVINKSSPARMVQQIDTRVLTTTS